MDWLWDTPFATLPTMKHKQSTQDYLKAIASLAQMNITHSVKPKDIAERLGVSPAAVTDMVRKLEQDGYVTSAPYKGLFLTETGRRVGANMIRHHRLWEVFLHDELGLGWDQVHDEAERLEHACSDALIDKIEEKLGYPRFDPHGNPIPDKEGHIYLHTQECRLAEARVTHTYTLSRVSRLDQEDLTWLGKLQCQIGARFTLEARLQKDSSVILRMDNGPLVALSAGIAESVYVYPSARLDPSPF